MVNDGKSTNPGTPHQNNCYFYVKYDHNTATNRVYLKASKAIGPDEELFASYGRHYWNKDEEWLTFEHTTIEPNVNNNTGTGNKRKSPTSNKNKNTNLNTHPRDSPHPNQPTDDQNQIPAKKTPQ